MITSVDVARYVLQRFVNLCDSEMRRVPDKWLLTYGEEYAARLYEKIHDVIPEFPYFMSLETARLAIVKSTV